MNLLVRWVGTEARISSALAALVSLAAPVVALAQPATAPVPLPPPPAPVTLPAPSAAPSAPAVPPGVEPPPPAVPAPLPEVPPPAPAPAPPPPPLPPAPPPAPPIVAVDPEPEPAAPAPRRFNLGAGFGLSTAPAPSSTTLPTSVPLRLSFEVGLASATWLMANAAVSHTKFDAPVLNLVDPTKDRTSRLTQNTLLGTVGLRQILVAGLVDFSVFGGLQLGNTWVNGEALEPAELSAGPQAGSSALLAGGIAGVAVERELVESLSLRIGVEVLSLRWLRTTSAQMTDDGVKETTLSETSFGLALDPSLELRLYF